MAFIVREPTRKVHITRILGTNKDGDVLPDIWLDVERFEQYLVNSQTAGNQFQQIIRKFRWHDDPDDADEYRPEDDDDTARLTVVLKVCAPDEADLNDPEEWVPVRVIKRVQLQGGDDPGSATNQRFITAILTAERKVMNRRTSHYDTSIDDKAEAAFDANPARKAFVVKSADYEKDDETKDDSQYVECELVTALTKQASEHAQSNGTDQQVFLQFKNKYLIEETDEAKLEELGRDDRNPPYRLDPFQNIVNVNFALTVLVVFFNPGGSFLVPNDLKDKGVKDLGSFSISEGSSDPPPLHVFKVNSGLDQVFVTSTSRDFALPSVSAFVCPMTGDNDKSLEDALKSVREFFTDAVSGEPLPVPEGILWMASLAAGPPSAKIDWKVAYVKHRVAGSTPPKDLMVQVYPLSIIPATFVVAGPPDFTNTYSGFNIVGYRLDKKATGQLYDGGNSRGSTNIQGSPPGAWTSDVIWTSSAGGGGNYGVKFQDELPLISDDIPV